MSKSRCRELVEVGDKLFSGRSSLMSLWQDIAEQFHPERADFTTKRNLGEEFASHLMTGFPALQMRELADQLAGMLRPRQKLWAKLVASNDRINDDTASRQWLEAKSEVMRRAMYERNAQFLRATKAGDKDFVAFGQTVIQPSLNRNRDGLLYRCWHLRDVAWCEDADMRLDAVHRLEKMTARTLLQFFPKTVSNAVKEAASKDPYKEFECRHIVVKSDQYDYGQVKNKDRFPFVHIYLDKDNDTILEEVPQPRLGYVIPRWSLGSMGQYASSPCTMLALPDARLMQQMTVSLLEASEKGANPPMVATQEAVRSDVQLFAGGLTWVDRDYDERLGDALRPITQDMSGMRWGMESLRDVREQMKAIFFLNKINLPEVGRDMTAFETRERVNEYVRSALPLFEPMEVEYNGAICEETFAILLENGAFGPPDEMPEALMGADVRFDFESPLQATAERVKAEAFKEVAELIGIAAQVDPSVVDEVDVSGAFRDALDGTQAPADWKRDPKMVEHLRAERAKAQQEQAMMAQISQGAQIAQGVGKAANELAGIRPQ